MIIASRRALRARLVTFALAALAFSGGRFASAADATRTTRLLLAKDTYVVEQSAAQLRFSSKSDKVLIAIEDCNRAHVEVVLDELERRLKGTPRIPLESARRLAGHVTVERDGSFAAVPANDKRGRYLASLPETFSELSVASRRSCGH